MNNKQLTLLIIGGVLWFLVLVINKVPAALVINHLAGQLGGIKPSRLQGTLWDGQGSFRVTSIVPALSLEKVSWSISPMKLFLGEFDAYLHIKDDFRYLQGHVQFDLLDQDIKLSNMKGRVDTALIQPYLSLPIKVDGMIDLDIQEFENESMKPTALKGRVIVESLSINTGQKVDLGTFAADLGLVPNEAVANIRLTDVDAVVELSGNAQFTTSFDYYVDATVKPKPSANPMIKNTLEFAGYPENADGFYKIVVGKPLAD